MVKSLYSLGNTPFAPQKITRQITPEDTSAGIYLLETGGYVSPRSAGVYDLLPLGLAALNRIRDIIREEMLASGAFEAEFASLQLPDIWQASGRWSEDTVDVWLKTESRTGSQYGLAFTHEEPVTDALTHRLTSYKQLPLSVFQFQTKFRDELRPRAGLLRLREFEMKDAYTFSLTEEEHREMYERIADAYARIFARVGIADITHRTLASGGTFSRFSEEYQTELSIGEDTIYRHIHDGRHINAEIFEQVISQEGLSAEDFVPVRAVEVGNIFTLNTRYSAPLGLYVANDKGHQQAPLMGSYGIGTHRLLGVIAQQFAQPHGIQWPDEVAPFDVHVITIGKDSETINTARELAGTLASGSLRVAIDDSKRRFGEKIGSAEQVGAPHLIIVGGKSAKDLSECEYQQRGSSGGQVLSTEHVINLLMPTAPTRILSGPTLN